MGSSSTADRWDVSDIRRLTFVGQRSTNRPSAIGHDRIPRLPAQRGAVVDADDHCGKSRRRPAACSRIQFRAARGGIKAGARRRPGAGVSHHQLNVNGSLLASVSNRGRDGGRGLESCLAHRLEDASRLPARPSLAGWWPRLQARLGSAEHVVVQRLAGTVFLIRVAGACSPSAPRCCSPAGWARSSSASTSMSGPG